MRSEAPPLQLVVEGTITDKEVVTPRTRLGGTPAPDEASFTLDLTAARLSDGTEQSAATIWPATFAGHLMLDECFAVGDRVVITCTTATGRFIASMESVASDDESE